LATITQIRGALLEEAVLYLLKLVGYDPFDVASIPPQHLSHMRSGHSGLEVRGRGTWHQLDALALWRHSPAFMYPMLLTVEAKCYSAHRPVGIEVPRNCVGVIKDISENYFTLNAASGGMRAPRFNYASAIFSTSGFTKGAVEYAVAHQVFLIQYRDVPVIEPLVRAILDFRVDFVRQDNGRPMPNSQPMSRFLVADRAVSSIRAYFRAVLNDQEGSVAEAYRLTPDGMTHLSNEVANACRRIRGSYFGMLQGRWPIHLLREQPLPAAAFESDSVQCRVRGDAEGHWRFEPLSADRGSAKWFQLEFSLPQPLAELVAAGWEDPIEVANLKQQHFSYIDVSGVIGGVRRSVRLELNQEWIRHYVDRERNRHDQR
jgi:hypothetical protein